MQAIHRRKALVLFRGNATDDERVAAAAVDEMEALRDITAAYAAEVRAQWQLPRGEMKATLHRAFAAVEADDRAALSDALLEAAELLGRPHERRPG